MTEIKRWTLKQTGATLLGDKNGEWVSYTDHIEALSQRPADPAWISVETELPEERELVLACLEDGTRLISSWFKWETMPEPLWHGFVPKTADAEHNVTHWQPLPAPPLASPVPKEK